MLHTEKASTNRFVGIQCMCVCVLYAYTYICNCISTNISSILRHGSVDNASPQRYAVKSTTLNTKPELLIPNPRQPLRMPLAGLFHRACCACLQTQRAWLQGSRASLLLMDKILHYLKDPKLWELWYIPYYG